MYYMYYMYYMFYIVLYYCYIYVLSSLVQKVRGQVYILIDLSITLFTCFIFVKDSLANPAAKDNGHVFISYQWDAKPTVLNVRDRLKAAGFRVWIDEDDMSKLKVIVAHRVN